MGRRARGHALHALVPAAHGHHGREARQLHLALSRRRRDHGVLGQGAHQGRARRLVVPQRRPARNLRGARLHRLGSHVLCLHQGPHPLHPHGVLLLRRAGTRQEDASFAFHGSAEQAGAPHPAPLRQHRGQARRLVRRPRAGVLPRHQGDVRAASRPALLRSHALRRQAAQGPGAR